MPDRIIHERACQSPTLDRLSDGAERLFWRLTSKADDQGRFDADARSLLASCFPLRIGRLPARKVECWRSELARVGLVDLYQASDRLYGAFRTWDRWQRKRESRPKRPGPDDPGVLRQDAATCGGLPLARAGSRDERRESLTTESREPLTQSPRAEAAEEPPPVPAAAGPQSGPEESWKGAPWGSAEALAHLYNTQTPDNVPAVETLSPKRRERARRCLRVFPAREWWEEVFAEYRRSKFLSGKTQPKTGHESFRPDFDWLLSVGKNGAENAVKVHDGAYR